MCMSSPDLRLVVSTVVPLAKVVIFDVKRTVNGDEFILLGKCFGRPLRVWRRHISFITLSDY